jgi:hypothetical protein
LRRRRRHPPCARGTSRPGCHRHASLAARSQRHANSAPPGSLYLARYNLIARHRTRQCHFARYFVFHARHFNRIAFAVESAYFAAKFAYFAVKFAYFAVKFAYFAVKFAVVSACLTIAITCFAFIRSAHALHR